MRQFPDGSVMTSRDVKASYDKITHEAGALLPQGRLPCRRRRSKAPARRILGSAQVARSSFLVNVSSPFNGSTRRTAPRTRWYETNAMHRPFKFVEHVGFATRWKRNPDYGQGNHIDGRGLLISASSAQVGHRGERAHIGRGSHRARRLVRRSPEYQPSGKQWTDSRRAMNPSAKPSTTSGRRALTPP